MLVFVGENPSAADIELLELVIVGRAETIEAHPPQAELLELGPIIASFGLEPVGGKERNTRQYERDSQYKVDCQPQLCCI